MGTVPAPTSPRWLIADALARVVALRWAIEDGYPLLAREHAEALEYDLLALRARLEEAAA